MMANNITVAHAIIALCFLPAALLGISLASRFRTANSRKLANAMLIISAVAAIALIVRGIFGF